MTPHQHELIPNHFTRSYDLALTMDSTIPNRAQHGEPGTHWVARGLMAETCAQMLGRPVRLEHSEHEHVASVSALVSLASSILTSDPLGALLSVDLLISRATGRWALLVQDRMVGTGPCVPSPSHLAGLVLTDHYHRRSPITATCRGTDRAAEAPVVRAPGPATCRRPARDAEPAVSAGLSGRWRSYSPWCSS